MKNSFVAFGLCLSIGIAILIAGNNQSILPSVQSLENNPYDPRLHNIPEYIAGYKVWAVITPDNLACMNPGEWRIVVQSDLQPVPTPLVGSQSLFDDLEQMSKDFGVKLVPSITSGPMDIGSFVQQMAEWNHSMENGCITTHPIRTSVP